MYWPKIVQCRNATDGVCSNTGSTGSYVPRYSKRRPTTALAAFTINLSHNGGKSEESNIILMLDFESIFGEKISAKRSPKFETICSHMASHVARINGQDYCQDTRCTLPFCVCGSICCMSPEIHMDHGQNSASRQVKGVRVRGN